MRPFRSLFRSLLGILAAMALLASACSDPQEPPSQGPATPPATFPLTLTDDDGISVTLTSQPRRIVTFAPSNTEIVFALGLGERLVGVSGKFDDYPPAAKQVEEVGGAGDFGVDPNIEKVVALQPDLLLAIAGGDHWKVVLRDLGVPVFTIDAIDFDDLLADIRAVGRLAGATAEAARLTADMAQQAQQVEEQTASGASVRCFFEVYYPPLTTVGPGTFISDLLERAGCDSVSEDARRPYPEWSVDDLVAHPPDVYLVSSESGVSPAAVADRPGFGAIDAVAEGQVVLIDSDLVSRPGPRVVAGLESLAEALHPEPGA